MKESSSVWMAKGREAIHKWEKDTEHCQENSNGGVGKAQKLKVKKVIEDGGYGNGVKGVMVAGCTWSEASPFGLVPLSGRWAPVLREDVTHRCGAQIVYSQPHPHTSREVKRVQAEVLDLTVPV